MRHTHPLAMLALCMLLVFTGTMPATAPRAYAGPGDSPPQRSSVYNGSSRVQYTYRPDFNISGAMTIEAWVYREDSARCETILSNNYANSYWLGFCPRPRFYRLGGSAIDATRDVPAYQWTHVAVSYDGATVRFYIDGEAAGSAALTASGSGAANPLIVGGDSGGFYFDGALDEVRLWTTARTQDAIQAGMFAEIRAADGLLAAFGNGGNLEEIAGISGSVSGTVATQVIGMLPSDLTIPQLPIAPTIDGSVAAASEYIGAERMVLRYRDGETLRDMPAYLGYDADNLYIGVRFDDPASIAVEDTNDYIALMLDPNGSRDELAQADDVQIRVPLYASAPSWLVGDGAGGWVAPAAPPESGPSGLWDAAIGSCASEFAPLCVEIRVSRSLFGPLSEIDNLALGHFRLDLGGGDADYLAPGQAQVAAPATWSPVVYGGFSATLPRARFYGWVHDVALGFTPIAGYDVLLYYGSTPLYRTTTGADGSFFFNVPIPTGATLRIAIPGCTGCRYETATSGRIDLAPTNLGSLQVDFPGCDSGTCRYDTVQFRLLQPIGVTSITGYSVDRGSPPVRLRNDSDLRTPATRLRINGVNLHEAMDVYLARDILNCTQRPPRDECERSIVPVLDRALDGTWIEVEVPEFAAPIPYGGYYWGIYDRWVRPGNSGIGTAPWIYGADFSLVPPSYPELYGFGFENEDDGADIDEFLSVYGNNAYVCIGLKVGDTCAGVRAPDPLYWGIWFPVFHIWIDQANGSCVGMAATSLLMARSLLDPERYDANVLYPAGFTTIGKPKRWDYGTFGPVFQAPAPANNWSEIRRNHGVQTSAEFLSASIDGMIAGPTAVLAQVRSAPTNYVLCMSPGLGSGHCVTPFGVEDISPTQTNIKIYDNNFPNNPNRIVTIDPSADTFTFPRSSGDWSGRMIYAIPINVWQRGRSMPLDIPGIVTTAIFGAADGIYSTSDGGRWGFEDDGTAVESIPGAISFSPLSQGAAAGRAAVLGLPTAAPSPEADIRTHGGDYLFFAMQDGVVLQLAVDAATDGERDAAALGYDGGSLRSLTFSPQSERNAIEPRVGMELGERARVLFRWRGLNMPGGSGEFTALPEARGAEFSNDTGSELSYEIVLEVIDGESGTAASRTFGPFTVPNGATHRMVIADWPASTQLLSTIDLNGDGTPESSAPVTGTICTPQDTDGDGAPDLCIAAAPAVNNTIYLPLLAK